MMKFKATKFPLLKPGTRPVWGLFAALLLLVSAAYAGPKAGGDLRIYDDLLSGSVGSAGAVYDGFTLSGAAGQTAPGRVSADGQTLNAGYFPALVKGPASLAYTSLSSNTLTLGWSAPSPVNPEGTLYEAQLSDSGSFTAILSTAGTYGYSTSFGGLTAGVTYYARVRASYMAGDESAWSALGSTVVAGSSAPVGAISPQSFSAVGISSLTANWGSTFSTGTLYYVRLSSTGNSADITASSNTANTWATFTGLENNKLYYAFVSTTAGSGFTASGSGYTLAAAPSSPAFFELRYSSAAISWSAGANPVGTVYQFEVSISSAFAVAASTGAGTTSPGWLTGLAPGTTYYGRVRAMNGDGVFTSYAVVPSSGVTLGTSAGVLGAAPFSAVSTGALTVNWTTTFGAGTTYYLRLSTTPSAAAYVSSAATTAGAYTFGSLAASKLYYGYVSTTAASGHINSGSGYTLPATPLSPSFSAVYYSSAVLSCAPGGNSDAAVYFYEVSASSDFAAVVSSASAASTSTYITDLAEGATYYGRVRVRNGDGLFSGYAVAVSSIVTLRTGPITGVLGALPFSGISTGAVTVNWTTTYPGGVTYHVRLSNVNSTATFVSSGATTATSFTFGGLGGNNIYYGFVSTSPASDFLASGSNYTLARPPTGASFLSVRYSSASINCSGAGNNAGTSYEYTVSLSSSFTAVVATNTVIGTTGWLTNLSEAATYYGRVRAQNGEGLYTSYALTPSPAVTLVTPPAVQGASFTGIGTSSLTVNWVTSLSSGTVYYARLSTTALAVDYFVGASTTATYSVFTGLNPNKLYYGFVSTNASSGFIPSGISHTLAAAPSPASFSGVYYSSAAITAAGNGNPAGTVYHYEISVSSAFSILTSTVTVAATTGTLTGLLEGATYYGRVRAANGDGVFTAYALTATTATRISPAPAPVLAVTNITGSVQGSTSVQWTWNSGALTSASGYKLYTGAGSLIDAIPFSTGSVSYTQTGLPVNTAASVKIAAYTGGGEGPLTQSAAYYTYAAQPSSVAVTAVYTTSATINWELNGNPSGTQARVQRTYPSEGTNVVLTPSTAPFTDYGLLGCSTYYFSVWHLNGDNVPSASSRTLNFVTGIPMPPPPGDFYAELVSNTQVTLYWAPAPFEGITDYLLYSGSPTISYASPLATLSNTQTSYTYSGLTSGTTYQFHLRARHRCGTIETNTGVIASVFSPPTLSQVRAAIKIPQTGKRVNGNSVTVMAELVSGTIAETQNISFQFKPSTNSLWENIAPRNAGTHPNPDPSSPYFIHWDVSGLAQIQYDLRAVATSRAGVTDSAPAAITISVGSADADIVESSSGTAVIKEQKVSSLVNTVMQAGDSGAQQVTRLEIPAAALSGSTATVTVTNNPADLPPTPADATPAGVATRITISDQTSLAAGKTAAIVLYFPDADGDGVLDGTDLLATQLEMYSAPSLAGPWSRDLSSVVDLARRKVTGYTSHFSFFALFAPISTGVSQAKAYPVPWQPGSGGRFDSSGLGAGIVLDKLTATTEVKIFTVTGQLVRSLKMTAASPGYPNYLLWDGKNAAGKDVVSGVYLAHLKSGGSVRILKLAVER